MSREEFNESDWDTEQREIEVAWKKIKYLKRNQTQQMDEKSEYEKLKVYLSCRACYEEKNSKKDWEMTSFTQPVQYI